MALDMLAKFASNHIDFNHTAGAVAGPGGISAQSESRANAVVVGRKMLSLKSPTAVQSSNTAGQAL